MARSRDDDDDDRRPARRDRDDDRGRDDDDRPRRSREESDDRGHTRERGSRDDSRGRDRDRSTGRDRDDDRPRASRSRDDDDDRGSSRRKPPEYVERTADDVRRHATQPVGSFEGTLDQRFPNFRAREGLNAVRLLQGTFDDRKQYAYLYFRHENIGPDRSTFVCLEKTFGKPCPICDERSRFTGDESNDLRPRKRYLSWIIDRFEERAGPKLWDFSPTMDKEIATLCMDRTGRVIHIDNPEEGYDVEFSREGTKLNTRYVGVKIVRDPSPMHDNPDKQDEWLEFIEDNPLPSVLVIPEYDYVAKAFKGQLEQLDKDLDRRKDDPDGAPRSRERGRDREDRQPERRSRGGRDEETSSRSLRDELDDRIPEKGAARERSRDVDDDPPKRERMNRSSASDDEEDRGRGRSSRDRERRDPDEERSSTRSGRDRDSREESRAEPERTRRDRGRDAESDDDDAPRSRSARNGHDRDDDDRPSRRTRDDDDVSATTRERLRDMGERRRGR